MPQIQAYCNTIDNEEKETIRRANNFFCSLHGLVHMANAAQKDLNDESGYFCLIRMACKTFTRRGIKNSSVMEPSEHILDLFSNWK